MISLRFSASFVVAAAAVASMVGCSTTTDDVTDGSAELGSASIAAQIVTIARGLTGERGPFADKAYYLAGKEPDGSRCIVTLTRNDASSIGAAIYTVGSNPPSEMAFDLYSSNPVSTPKVNVSTTSTSIHAAVVVESAPDRRDSNEVEAQFAGARGFEGLSRVHIFTDQKLSATEARHVEATCSELKPLVTVDRDADGPALSRKARAFYEAQHHTTLADPVDLLGCGFGDKTDRIICSFDSGLGNDDHDVPPDQLEVTFAVAGQKVGAVLSASLNGE
jgi:hypothetical protein